MKNPSPDNCMRAIGHTLHTQHNTVHVHTTHCWLHIADMCQCIYPSDFLISLNLLRVKVLPRNGLKKVEAKGLFTEARVMRGRHWKWNNQDGEYVYGKSYWQYMYIVCKLLLDKLSYSPCMSASWWSGNSHHQGKYQCCTGMLKYWYRLIVSLTLCYLLYAQTSLCFSMLHTEKQEGAWYLIPRD